MLLEQWKELKETIIELRDNDGTATQQEVCKFLANLMEILEKQMQEPKYPCDLCRYNPPSSCDGKPCTMCPAQATERFKDKLESGYFRKRI